MQFAEHRAQALPDGVLATWESRIVESSTRNGTIGPKRSPSPFPANDVLRDSDGEGLGKDRQQLELALQTAGITVGHREADDEVVHRECPERPAAHDGLRIAKANTRASDSKSFQAVTSIHATEQSWGRLELARNDTGGCRQWRMNRRPACHTRGRSPPITAGLQSFAWARPLALPRRPTIFRRTT
jgi:hypothetical protein